MDDDVVSCGRCSANDNAATTYVTLRTRHPSGAGGVVGTFALHAEFRRKYELITRLGRGAFGVVYEAEAHDTGERVAIKFLLRTDDAEMLARFVKEGELMRAIDHPGVVAVREVGAIDGFPYLVTELLKGGSLRDRMGRTPPPGLEEVVTLARECLAGLRACHDRGIVHRDLKPENVLLDARGHAKLADLGIAKSYGDGERLTAAGAVMGTPIYMSPEQIRGEPAGHASDLYAMGVMLYELLAGEPPFSGRTLHEMFKHHLETVPPSLHERRPEIPPALSKVVQSALAKRVDERIRSAADFSLALARVVAPVSKPSGPAAAPPVGEPAARPRPPGAMVAGAVGLALMVGAFGMMRAPRPVAPRSPAPARAPSAQPARAFAPAVAASTAVMEPAQDAPPAPRLARVDLGPDARFCVPMFSPRPGDARALLSDDLTKAVILAGRITVVDLPTGRKLTLSNDEQPARRATFMRAGWEGPVRLAVFRHLLELHELTGGDSVFRGPPMEGQIEHLGFRGAVAFVTLRSPSGAVRCEVLDTSGTEPPTRIELPPGFIAGSPGLSTPYASVHEGGKLHTWDNGYQPGPVHELQSFTRFISFWAGDSVTYARHGGGVEAASFGYQFYTFPVSGEHGEREDVLASHWAFAHLEGERTRLAVASSTWSTSVPGPVGELRLMGAQQNWTLGVVTAAGEALIWSDIR